jgi:hypothetical protein
MALVIKERADYVCGPILVGVESLTKCHGIL